MSQMNKGGKFIFGKSLIRDDLSIHLPTQALTEYSTTAEGKVYLFTGSKITGGDNLPLADYFGTADGRDKDKMDVAVEWEKGTALPVPILSSSPRKLNLFYVRHYLFFTRPKQRQSALACMSARIWFFPLND